MARFRAGLAKRIELLAIPLREFGDAARTEGDLQSVLVIPDGHVRSTKGDFHLNERAAKAVIVNFRNHGADVPIDYEHQTLGGEFGRRDGKAPAAGWITKLAYKPGEGMYARVKWTIEGESDVFGESYRYLSPVVLVDKRSRDVVALHSVALTNMPAIKHFPPLIAHSQSHLLESLVMADGPSHEPDSLDALFAKLKDALGITDEAPGDALSILNAAIEFITDARGPAPEESANKIMSRDQVIASARRDYKRSKEMQAMTSINAHIEFELRANRHAPLSTAEREKIAVEA